MFQTQINLNKKRLPDLNNHFNAYLGRIKLLNTKYTSLVSRSSIAIQAIKYDITIRYF